MNKELNTIRQHPLRVIAIVAAFFLLGIIFVFQKTDLLALACRCHLNGAWHFIANKTARLILNDACMLIIIYYWFNDRNVSRLALYIQLFDLLILLPAYLAIKLILEGDSEISSPLLSQLHRLIVNPTLMILFFPAIYFQRLKTTDHNE